MLNGKIPKKESRDAVSHHLNWIPQFIRNLGEKMGLMVNRDGCRTPMQWDGSENAGFCPPEVEPWLPVNPAHEKRNVQRESKNVGSLLNCYKRLLKIRNEHLPLQVGDIRLVDLGKMNKKVLAYSRNIDEESIYVYLNLSKETVTIPPLSEEMNFIFSTLPNRVAFDLKAFGGKIAIYPKEGIIYK